jgi:hypothetical protein
MRLAVPLPVWALIALVSGDVSASATRIASLGVEPLLTVAQRPTRVAAWAERLPAIPVRSEGSSDGAMLRLYASDGSIDGASRAEFERIAAQTDEPHRLSLRLEQLVFKAAYHFRETKDVAVVIVSGFRYHAGRHGTAEAIDFKLRGVPARALAAYLRGMPRAGVGVYIHPQTQYVHLDVRDPSYHWIDASPPGVHWHEAQIADRNGAERDASWQPDMDLPER